MRSHITSWPVTVALWAAAVIALAVGSADAQVVVNYVWQPTEPDNWNEDANWSGDGLFVVPDAGLFPGESAVINNGGTAIVDQTDGAVPPVAGLSVTNGVLDIQQGGAVTTVNDGVGNGRVSTGGSGTINLSGNGALTVGTIAANADASNSGTVRLTGTSASLQINGDFDNTATGTFVPRITDLGNHSTINVTGTATLGGSLALEFQGVTPVVGNSWTLIDAGSVSGSFDSVAPLANAPLGQAAFVSTSDGGSNGKLVSATIDNQLVVSINIATGATSIRNFSTTETETIDAYGIFAATNTLNPGAWTPLADGDPDWQVGNPAANHLSELNFTGSLDITPGSSISLGDIYVPPTEFGVAPDPVSFQYNLAGNETRDGGVVLPANNLVLQVDPSTGEAQIVNPSAFDVNIDGYGILSASGSLDPVGWTPLADSDPDWQVGNPADNHLSELNFTGSKSIAKLEGGAPLALGPLFDFDAPGAQQDLEFEFNLAGDPSGRFTGVVEYLSIVVVVPVCDFDGDGSCDIDDLDPLVMELSTGGQNLTYDVNGDNVIDDQDLGDWLVTAGEKELGPGRAYLEGDANLDGSVDVSDFNQWNSNKFTGTGLWSLGDFNADGSSDVSDFNLWNNNKFTSSDSVQGVPEPSGIVLLLIALGSTLIGNRKKMIKTSRRFMKR